MELFSDLPITNMSTSSLIEVIAKCSKVKSIVVALHVTALNSFKSGELSTKDFEKVDLLYADGWSVQLLNYIVGNRKAQRVATTDLLPLVLSSLHSGREKIKIGIIGGEEGVAELVKENWNYVEEAFLTFNGFQEDWPKILKEMREFQPDLVLLGLGMPLELKFINQFYDQLPSCLLLTCGGLLRILAKTERRSPMILQLFRLEWLFRILSHPKRNTSRYIKGIHSLFILSLREIRKTKS